MSYAEKNMICKKHISNRIPFLKVVKLVFEYMFISLPKCICEYMCMEKKYERMHTKSSACIIWEKIEG